MIGVRRRYDGRVPDLEEERMVDDGQVLEVLRAAAARLGEIPVEVDPKEWDFSEWPSCTCGHLYSAAASKSATGLPLSGDVLEDAIESPTDRLYLAVLEAVASVCGQSQVDGDGLAWTVSDGTREWAEDMREPGDADLPTLAAAREMVRIAISVRQREAMRGLAGATP